MKKMLAGLAIVLFIFSVVGTTNAALITADGTGNDNYTDTDYWGVSFDSGSGYISSVTFDISSFGGDFFDFDGAGSYMNSTSPVIGNLSGLLTSDITASFTGSQTTELGFDFALQSFMAGDYFRFSADIDQILAGNDLAGGLLFSVTMEDGFSGSGVFDLTSISNQSAVTLDIENTPVPEPSTMILLGIGLAGLFGFRKKFNI